MFAKNMIQNPVNSRILFIYDYRKTSVKPRKNLEKISRSLEDGT